MPTTLQVLRQLNDGIVYASPTKPDLTCRFKFTNSIKTLNGVSVSNNLREIIYNDNNPVVIGDVSANEAISVRIRVSGSVHSSARVRQLLLSFAAQTAAWEGQHVFAGFQPTTLPILIDP